MARARLEWLRAASSARRILSSADQSLERIVHISSIAPAVQASVMLGMARPSREKMEAWDVELSRPQERMTVAASIASSSVRKDRGGSWTRPAYVSLGSRTVAMMYCSSLWEWRFRWARAQKRVTVSRITRSWWAVLPSKENQHPSERMAWYMGTRLQRCRFAASAKGGKGKSARCQLAVAIARATPSDDPEFRSSQYFS